MLLQPQPAIDEISPSAIDMIAEEFNRIIEVNLHELDETQVGAFVDLGEAMGLERARALEIVAELINHHLEDAEARGLNIELICEGEDDYFDALIPETQISEPVADPAAISVVETISAPVPEVREAPVQAEVVTGPRVVRLGRLPSFERGSPSADAERKQNPDFKHTAGVPMIYIPSGSFLLGSDDPASPKNERPCALATLSGYFISRYPITNKEYEKFDASHRAKRLPNAGDDHPVVFVTSIEAAKFCDWLSKGSGRRFRLPTEAEWEYAARGTTGRTYPWGEEEGVSTVANFADARSRLAWRDTELDDGYAETAPVGKYPEGMSPFGIQDLAGNVFEWCLDFYDSYRPTPRTNPRGPAAGVNRVIRGGSYKSRYTGLRTTARSFSLPNCSANDIGFRVVCEAQA